MRDAEENYPYPLTIVGSHGLATAIRQYAERNGHIVSVTERNSQITITHIGRMR